MAFTDDLYNPDSVRYQQLKIEVEAWVRDIYKVHSHKNTDVLNPKDTQKSFLYLKKFRPVFSAIEVYNFHCTYAIVRN